VEPLAQTSVQPAQSTSNDLKLVADILRKDRKATAEFVTRYADSIYSYVRRRVMPRSDVVDDLVQEIFLAAWQGLANYRGDATLRQWFLGIARHKVEDYYRKRLHEADWPDGDDDSGIESAAAPFYEEEFDRRFLGEKVRSVIATLPEAYAVALFWRYLEDRSVREIAQLAGKTEKAVERLLARARAAFARRWDRAER